MHDEASSVDARILPNFTVIVHAAGKHGQPGLSGRPCDLQGFVAGRSRSLLEFACKGPTQRIAMSLRLSGPVRYLVPAVWFMIAGASRSLAADVPADLHIDRVTVYRQGAVVTRAGQVAVPAGSNRLVIRGLPAGIDAKTLRVTVEPASVQLGGIELAKINEGKFVSDAERELRRKIEDTADQRVAVQDEI